MNAAALYPLTFQPIFKERIWGGRDLEKRYGKPLPAGVRIGESWEICDRPGDENVIANGPLAGRTLGDLMRENPAALLGSGKPAPARFPILVKIIDAQETLSLQVHPPAAKAAAMGGEPKTEMWYVADSALGAELLVGLKQGGSRAEFERKLGEGTVAECFHRIPVHPGDSMFLPSGRVHALGAGMLIFEIQQNSDTTYRVFDWNRVDANGKGRELHVAQSLASIDFDDFEPKLLPSEFQPAQPGQVRPLVKNELFDVSLRKLSGGEKMTATPGRMEIIGVVEGQLEISSSEGTVVLAPGQFCMLPAACNSTTLQAPVSATFLEVFS